MSNVTIVIPTFNRANLLPETIDSCLNQTMSCEIIVCDHGSTDNTAEVIKDYGNQITYIRRDKDFGPHFCWLEGVLHASGDLVHLQFDDDLIEPTFIEDLTQLITDNVGFAFSNAAVFFPDGTEQYHLGDLFKEEVINSTRAEKVIIMKLVSPACAIFRKQDILDALYQGRLPLQSHDDHGVGPDKLMSLLCLLRYKKIAYINKPLARFRAHDASITISAHSDEESKRKIHNAYREVKQYYRGLKIIRFLEKFKPRKRKEP